MCKTMTYLCIRSARVQHFSAFIIIVDVIIIIIIIIVYCRSIDSLSQLITHTMDETFYSLKLTHELCVLPLAYQITCIVGNTLGRTLHGGRAERNEFLLLHAFTQKGYLPPDKLEKHKNLAPPTEGNEEGSGGKKNKSSYSGGLVLDPKVGLYKRFVFLYYY